jgi:hypothetical protein
MLRFEALIGATLQGADQAGWKPLPVAAEFERCTQTLPSGDLLLRTWRRGLAAQGELRIASIESPKIHVVTCFVYPHPALALPLYAIELVELGTRPIVAVLDLASAPGDPAMAWAHAVLDQAHEESPDLVNADDAPHWYASCRSGRDFFLRPVDSTQTDRVGQIHQVLLTRFLQAIHGVGTRAPAEQQIWSVFAANYKAHHARHSPGLPLMQRSFGEDWTTRYLKTCFFA